MPENLHYFTDGKTLKGIDLPQYPDSAWNWITGAPEDTKDEELYSRVAAVYRVANLSAEAIANVPFAVLKGDQEFDTSDDWQNKVGFLPNIRELLRLWRLSLFMTNSAYGFMEGNRVSKNLRYVVPGTITPQIDKWEGLTGFKRRIGTETTEYSLKDNRIFWMWRLDHTTELLPSKNSEFKALMAAAGVLYYADYYVQNFFQRGGIRPALLQVAGVPTREEREKIETVWDKIIHGWSKYLGKVISANEMDVKVIGDGIDNVANGQLHSEKLADVAMAAGMPLSIILANSANYATAQTEYLVWFRDSVVPWANFMQDEMNDKLFKPLGLHFEFRPEMSDKGQEEERQRAGAYRAYVASGMKPSIAAQVVGIDLPPDIEYEELDDVFVQPKPQPVNESEIQIEKEELPEPEDEKSVTLLTIDQLRELEHWQDLAFRKLKQGKSLMFPWVSKTLPEEVASVIRDRLPHCNTLAEIERAFDLNMPDTPDRQLRELADALNKAVEVVATEGKYSPNQPRVPEGHSDGGQWTDGDGEGPTVAERIYAMGNQNAVEPDFTGIDEKTLLIIEGKLKELLKKYPQLKGKFSVLVDDSLPDKAFAITDGSVIWLNKKHWQDYEKLSDLYENQTFVGFYPKYLEADSLITHEMGHVLDEHLWRAGIGTIKKPPSTLMAEMLTKKFNLGSPFSDQMPSAYATFSDQEFFAECFAQYTDTKWGVSPTPLSIEFGKILNEWMKDLP